eukprot:2020491-Amphidinium_carterae.4
MTNIEASHTFTHHHLPIRVHPSLVHVTQKLKKLLKAREPKLLTPSSSLLFLGVRLEYAPTGLFIHQQSYTKELIKKFGYDEGGDHPTPDMSSPAHKSKVHCGQQMLGGLLVEAIRIAKLEGQVILTYVGINHQLADPLTKPTGTQIKQGFHPAWRRVKKITVLTLPTDILPTDQSYPTQEWSQQDTAMEERSVAPNHPFESIDGGESMKS